MERGYFLRRFVQMVFTLWVIITIIFFMFRLIPADPAALMLDTSLTPEAKARMLEIWGLDKPLPVQLGTDRQGYQQRPGHPPR